MRKVLYVSLFIIIISLTGCGYDVYEMPEEAYINLNDNIFEVFNEYTVKDLVSDTNTEILFPNKKIDTDKIGDNTYVLDYSFKKRKYKLIVNYSVIDSVKPVFIGASNELEMLVNSDDNICDMITFGDNYDNKPTCSINGEYNINEVGVYDNLEYVIKDSSLNENTKKFKLKVVNKITKVNNNRIPKYLYIDDIIKNYKNENTSIGIDVSKWQGNVDFKKVKDAGIEFVIMRIGSQRDPSDDIEVDVKFKEYYNAVKDAGLKFSVYVYNTAISTEDGEKVANWVINMLDGDKLDYPIAYDWENWSNFNKYNISLHTLSDSYLAFERTLKKAGYDAMLYSSKFYLENVWMNYENSNIWLAHYTDKTDYKGKYMLWQMTSLAKIDGITENTVDIDILYN